MRVLITRPQHETARLARELAALGHEVVAAPLFSVAQLPAPADLDPRLRASQAVLLTSANGARALAAATMLRSRPVYAVGQATAATAEGLGFATVFSADGDAAALVELVRRMLKPGDGSLLHASGEDVATDLGERLAAHGFSVDRAVLYAARAAPRLPQAASLAIATGTIDAVALFSPRAASTLAGLLHEAGLADRLSSIAAVAISDAALAPVADLGWRRSIAAAEPTMAGVLQALQSLAPGTPPAPKEATMSDTDQPAGSMPARTSVPASDPAAAPAAPQAARAAAPAGVPPAPVRRGVGVFGALVCGVIGALIVLGAAALVVRTQPELLRSILPVAEAPPTLSKDDVAIAVRVQLEAASNALGGRIDAAEGRQVELRRRVEDLQGKIAALPAPANTQEMAALRESAAAALREVQGLQALVPQLQSQAAALDNRLRQVGAQGASTEDMAALKARLERLEGDAQRLARTAGSSEDAAALRGRLEKLEGDAQRLTQTVGVASDAATRAADKETVERTIAGLRRELEAKLAEFAKTSADLGKRAEAIEGDMRQRVEQLAASRTDADRRATDNARAAAAIALSARLRQTVDVGAPFEHELALLEPLAKSDPRFAPPVDVLRPIAATGAPSRASLRAEYPAMAKAALAADVVDDSVGERALAALKSLVSVRRVGSDVAGETVEARLARAEAALQAGDFTAAVKLVKTFSGKPAEAAKAWLARAETYLAAQDALDRLSVLGVALLSSQQ